VEILFVAGFSPIVSDPAAGRCALLPLDARGV